MKRYEEIRLSMEQKRKIAYNLRQPKKKKNYRPMIVLSSFIVAALFFVLISINPPTTTINASNEERELIHNCMTTHSCFVKENIILWSINVCTIMVMYTFMLFIAVKPDQLVRFRLVALLHQLAVTKKLYRVIPIPFIIITAITIAALFSSSPNQLFIWSLVLVLPTLFGMLQLLLWKKYAFKIKCPNCHQPVSKLRMTRTCKHCKEEYVPVINTQRLMFPFLFFILIFAYAQFFVSNIQLAAYMILLMLVNIITSDLYTSLEKK